VYVVYDIFVHGKAGRTAPYSIKLLTQLQLIELLTTIKLNKKSNFFLLIFLDIPTN